MLQIPLHPPRPARLAAASACLLVALCGAAGCTASDPPNLLVIVVDTLRFDHLGAYGSPRDTSPALDALAAEGVRFERAYATAPWTQPSVASMITGLQPAAHGADRLLRSLPDSAETLAEVLVREGFATGSVVSHWLIGPRFGFDQGVETFVHGNALGSSRFSTPGVSERASELLETFAIDRRPFFLLVHYFDPHYDYQRHPAHGFAADSAGRLSGAESIAELRALDPPPSEDERRLVRGLYDEEIRFTDAGIGRVLRTLARLDLDANTVVVLVADHGEEFFERGWLGHTRTLYEELWHVPLVIRPAGHERRPRVVSEPVSLVALMPTLLDLVGVASDGLAFHGSSFAPLVRGEPGWEPEIVYGSTEYWEPRADGDAATSEPVLRRKHAVLRGDRKLIEDRDTGRLELYDVGADPREQRDLLASEAARHQAEVEDLSRALREAAERAEAARLGDTTPAAAPSPAEREMLRKIGYIAD